MVERVDADERLRSGIEQPFDGPFDALPFLFSAHVNRARPGRLSADINRSAPEVSMCLTGLTAAFADVERLPSKNESGVQFRTPMMRGTLKASFSGARFGVDKSMKTLLRRWIQASGCVVSWRKIF